MTKILIINGPNLNMLGTREPEIYGAHTLSDVEDLCHKTAEQLNLEAVCFQSNHEGAIIDKIQESLNNIDGVVINAGAYTHTSIAIHDALKLLTVPIIEVHISDIQNREEFRKHSYISYVAADEIIGKGIDGYAQAIEKIRELIPA